MSKKGYGRVVITKEQFGCTVVELSADHMDAGGTVSISIKKRLEDGVTIVPYPAGTLFSLSVKAGQENGTLVGSGGSGNSITTTSPAQFIANAAISGDSVVVTIHAGLSTGSSAAKGKNSAAKIENPMCTEPPEANEVVKGNQYPPCAHDLKPTIFQQTVDDNSHCSTSDGGVKGGATYVEWWPAGLEGKGILVTVCQVGENHPRLNMLAFRMTVVAGICNDNIKGEHIKDLSSVPNDKSCDVLRDFNAQIKFLLDKNNDEKPVEGKYALIPSYSAHEKDHQLREVQLLERAAQMEQISIQRDKLSPTEAYNVLHNAYDQGIQAGIVQKRVKSLFYRMLANSDDERKARIKQAQVLSNVGQILIDKCKNAS
jgi:hypothetical protein